MKQNLTRIWVSPEFKKKLKKEAAEHDLELTELTKRLAQDNQSLEEHFQNINKKRGGKFELPPL